MTDVYSNPDHYSSQRGLEKYNAEVVGGFDYGSLSPEIADALRKQTARIRHQVKATTTAIVWIGRDLMAVKQMLRHGQFVQWVEAEFGFSIRTAENYMRAAKFSEDKCAAIALLPPATLYRISAKNAPPELVQEVVARAAGGAIVSDPDVIRMFRKYTPKRRAAGTGGESKAKDERASCAYEDPNREIAKANVQDILKRFGRDGAAFLLGIRPNILETLSLLAQEINGLDGGGTP